ncbi:hypothetical protein U9M48_041299 [Paspalum notatum var. saurae]|uniref:Uncharacterized protein n=1 Tax=Paspalum notatum var. saurae TaxID=547442 RepID=A0AAQ3UNX3_PASNO
MSSVQGISGWSRSRRGEHRGAVLLRSVRLGLGDQAKAEVAYQTSVSINGPVFKGILHDVGPHSLGGVGRGGGPIEYNLGHVGNGSAPSTTAAGLGNLIVSSTHRLHTREGERCP